MSLFAKPNLFCKETHFKDLLFNANFIKITNKLNAHRDKNEKFCTHLSVVVFLVLVSHHARAADWVIVDTGEKSVTAVDKNSISFSSPYTKAWILYDYAEGRELKGTYPIKQYKSSVALLYVDCPGRSIATKQEINYSENHKGGEAISSKTFQVNSAAFDDVVPESVGESILEFVCKNGSRTKAKSTR